MKYIVIDNKLIPMRQTHNPEHKCSERDQLDSSSNIELYWEKQHLLDELFVLQKRLNRVKTVSCKERLMQDIEYIEGMVKRINRQLI